MIQAIKKITHNKKHRSIAILLCILCVSAVSLSIWFFKEKRDLADFAKDENSPDVLTDLNDPQVPLSNTATTISAGDIATTVSAGDIVVVSVFADEMDDVYGYQFDMNYYTEYLEYRNRLYSDIDEITTIFATDKEQYLLVGATMIGDTKGYSGHQIPVCHVEFTALSDFDIEPDLTEKYITLSRVNVVKDDLLYSENVTGWTANITIA
ncbi:MAG: cohesin domain-containing protein [Oscillospiraceae bacterium]|nr:cohesin domain-containing protein [Oscillospiraceae bacterium]